MISAPRSHFSNGIREIALTLIQENKRYLTAKKGLFAEVGELLATARPKKGEASPVLPTEEEVVEIKPRWDEAVIEIKSAIHKRLLEEIDLKSLDLKETQDPKKREQVRETTKRAIEKILAQKADITLSRSDRTRLVLEILDEALGLGPLEDFLRDTTITEIMVNGKDKIYIEQKGKLYLSNKRFVSNDQLLGIIRRIVAPLGRRIDESSPMVDARLKDGSRVNAIIPPLAVQGPMLTIRKFPGKRLTAEDWIKLGSLHSDIVEFIRICVQARQNIIISGGTSSGKTTLLNIASSFIPQDERIVTIEDSAELKLEQEHIVTLESRPPNIEGKGAVPIRQLVINSLRMRPDRIVIGECRGGEALDMLQAMNTGHDGSLTTIHANSPRDVLSRLETMVLMAGMELPIRAIRDQVVAAIDIIVHLARFL
ncbi:CpaF family protein, partial [bacterium]|nr:CpaF family protein [bacterium]